MKKEKRTVTLNAEISTLNTEIDELIFNKEKLSNIKLVINKMKPEYQVAIYLADFEKLSYKEISKILKRTEKDIKNLIYRARVKLRELLKKEGITYES